jgi:hypothetical protein
VARISLAKHKRNEDNRNELQVLCIKESIGKYTNNWQEHLFGVQKVEFQRKFLNTFQVQKKYRTTQNAKGRRMQIVMGTE